MHYEISVPGSNVGKGTPDTRLVIQFTRWTMDFILLSSVSEWQRLVQHRAASPSCLYLTVDQRLCQGNFCHGVVSVAAHMIALPLWRVLPVSASLWYHWSHRTVKDEKQQTVNIQILVREKRNAAVEEKKGQCSDCEETANMEAHSHSSNANGANLDSLIWDQGQTVEAH